MEIKTKRLDIRNLQPGDWPELQKIFMDFHDSAYAVYDAPLPTGSREVQELAKQFSESQLFFAVFLHDSPDMMGYVCFHEEQGSYDLGYCFHSAYQGKGYAVEACRAMMEFLRQNYKAKRFTAGTALKNAPSCKLLEKLGFVKKETESISFHKDSAGKEIVFEGGIFVKEED